MARTYQPETGWRSVHANGVALAVFEDGPEDGPLVLLQHGYPDTPHTFDDLVEPLVARGFRVVRPWGRGIHPSARPDDGDYHTTTLARDLTELVPALGRDKAILLGHDWGAAAAWGAGHLAPERLHKLIVVAIPHPAAMRITLAKAWGVRHFLANRLPWAESRVRRDDFAELHRLYERWSPGFDWPDAELEAAKNAYTHPGSLDAALGYYRALGRWPFRGGVDVETLIIGGLTDGVATAEDFERSRSRVNAPCEVRMLPGGHFLHREHPEAFEEAVLEGLGDADRWLSPGA